MVLVLNKTPRKIVLKSNDSEPPEGIEFAPKTISLLTKPTRLKQPIIFTAIDAESGMVLLINDGANVSLVPSPNKNNTESLTISSGMCILV